MQMTHNYSVLHVTGNKYTRSSFFFYWILLSTAVTILMDDERFTEVHTQNGFINI